MQYESYITEISLSYVLRTNMSKFPCGAEQASVSNTNTRVWVCIISLFSISYRKLRFGYFRLETFTQSLLAETYLTLDVPIPLEILFTIFPDDNSEHIFTLWQLC